MKWQDIVISIAQIFSIIALIPSIRSKDKPAKTTSLIAMICVLAITICLFTLQLWLGSFTAFLIAVCWGILYIQKRKKP